MPLNFNPVEHTTTEQHVHVFNNCIAWNKDPVASEIDDFMMKVSYAFPSTDVLIPAPMAISILSQLAIVAASIDFKLLKPQSGFIFNHILYSNSFSAAITQLVDTVVETLNDSHTNFDEMNKHCRTVKSLVTEIIQLLVSHKSNTPEQNDMAAQRHLALLVESLRSSIKVCLDKAEITHNAFYDPLHLTMEILTYCVATHGRVYMEVQKAELRKLILEENEQATREMKRSGEEALQRARQDFNDAQKMFSDTATSVLGEEEHAFSSSRIATIGNKLMLGLHHLTRRTPPPPPPEKDATTRLTSQPDVSLNSKGLYTLLTVESDEHLDWDSIKSQGSCGCLAFIVKCEEVISSLTDDNPNISDATKTAIELAKRGIELADTAWNIIPPGNPTTIEQITKDVSAWHAEVIKFASVADLKLNTSLLSPPDVCLPPPPMNHSMLQKAKYVRRSVKYELHVAEAQLNASRAKLKATSDKLMEVNRQLGHIMLRLTQTDIQKHNWEESTSILLKAIGFLSELKMYLNNLVHFFDSVHNFVSHLFKSAADQFISVIKHASGIEDKPNGAMVKHTNGVTLDAWSRETIYKYALSTAKLSKVVQHISGMYVTLYNGHVHPGVNMLLGMGKHVGTQDHAAVASAGKQIQDWAEEANRQIVILIAQQMRANEEEIEKRMVQLEASFGVILPRSSKIDGATDAAKKKKIEEVTSTISAAAAANQVYGKGTRDLSI